MCPNPANHISCARYVARFGDRVGEGNWERREYTAGNVKELMKEDDFLGGKRVSIGWEEDEYNAGSG